MLNLKNAIREYGVLSEMVYKENSIDYLISGLLADSYQFVKSQFTVIEYGENSRLRIQEDKSLDKIIREDGIFLTREGITDLYNRLENKARELKITLNEYNQKINVELAGIIESAWEDGGLIT